MSARPWLSYHLPDGFTAAYDADRPVGFGFVDAGGNALGELVFLRTYSRRKPDGSKERWHEVCERVIEGTFSALKDHCLAHRLPWTDDHADHLAAEAYDRMFTMRWLPPGRGLWMMGTEFVHERHDATPLQNCAFVSTDGISPGTVDQPFAFLMMASMLGVGVGFDTRGAAAGIRVVHPVRSAAPIVISDDREGWVASVASIIGAFTVPDAQLHPLDYSSIRPAGSPIHGFGGTASGPEPLRQLHGTLVDLFASYAGAGRSIDSRLITDVANLIGRCVVAGNVRRSAEIALGSADDADFVGLKDYAEPANAARAAWGWVSNNSVVLDESVAPDTYDRLAELTAAAGEPGYVWLDVCRAYGRLADPPTSADRDVAGVNPCAEQTLESGELCTLVEVFPTRCTDRADFLRTLKFAYMYAKAVTLLPTCFEESNAVMARNRRIGTSVSGLAQFVDQRGWAELRTWLEAGYREVRSWDREYSRWLGVRESVKVSSVKPSGTVSLLAGVTPGVHWPVASSMTRTVRLGKDEPLVAELRRCGYRVEPAVDQPESTVVAYFPIAGAHVRTERQVSIWEKVELAALAQTYWADNAVSATVTFRPDERDQVARVLHAFHGRLKTLSLLPIADDVYPQMPYAPLDPAQYDELAARGELRPINWARLYDGADGDAPDAVGEAFCTTDRCEVPVRESEAA